MTILYYPYSRSLLTASRSLRSPVTPIRSTKLPEDEIETFLPQICNLLVESELSCSYDQETFEHFQDILIR